MIGIKLRYKGLNAKNTMKLNHKLFGSLHKYKANCMNYTPGFLHTIDYVKLYNSCYFIPKFEKGEIEWTELKDKIRVEIKEFCFDLNIEDFELPEDEYFSKYVFKNGYNYWKDYTKDLGRIFKCKAKHKLDIIQMPKE